MNLVLLDSLDRLLDHPPESPPGDDVPDDAGHVQQVSVLLVNLKDDGAVLAETLRIGMIIDRLDC